jgi:hypothetical protein
MNHKRSLMWTGILDLGPSSLLRSDGPERLSTRTGTTQSGSAVCRPLFKPDLFFVLIYQIQA